MPRRRTDPIWQATQRNRRAVLEARAQRERAAKRLEWMVVHLVDLILRPDAPRHRRLGIRARTRTEYSAKWAAQKRAGSKSFRLAEAARCAGYRQRHPRKAKRARQRWRRGHRRHLRAYNRRYSAECFPLRVCFFCRAKFVHGSHAGRRGCAGRDRCGLIERVVNGRPRQVFHCGEC